MGLMLFAVEQYKKVLEFVRVAQEEGATLVCGGKRPDVSYIFLLTF
jgi:acyl-CoA reductase-like NAD-dependent aldehyde dehydrogenase